MSNATLIFSVFMTLLALVPAYGQDGRIMTWSAWVNRPDWNQSLGVTASRRGCSNTPAMCVQSSCKTPREHHFQIFLAIPLDSHAVKYASEHSGLSLTCPELVEVGFDDLLDQYRMYSYSGRNPEKSLDEIIDHMKTANPRLMFGGSVYEDQLSKPGW